MDFLACATATASSLCAKLEKMPRSGAPLASKTFKNGEEASKSFIILAGNRDVILASL